MSVIYPGVAVKPSVRFGRPCLAGTRISVHLVSDRWIAGQTFRELADDLGKSAGDIESAVRFVMLLSGRNRRGRELREAVVAAGGRL